jgi:TolB protein
MTPASKSALVVFAVLCCAPAAARAQDTTATRGVRIGLTYAPGTRPGVLILPISGPNADSVTAILGRDLDYGDRVTVIASDAGDAPTGALNYQAYATAGAAAIVQASVTPSGSLHIAVHDVAGARVMNAWDFPLAAPALGADWRLAVHRGADEIERVITGVRGIAATRAAFVRDGSIWIIDADGFGAHVVPGTSGGLSPAWHPSGRYIAYDELASTGHQTIVVRDLAAGTSHRISTRYTLNMSPAFSPDGSTLVFAAGDDGSDLFSAAPFDNTAPARLMPARGFTNASPTFSPDGKQIAFTSNRLGHEEVYIMDADGTNPDLLTTTAFGDQMYRSDPDWSPDGRRVAFQSQVGGIFQIMAINLRDRSVQSLTSEGRNDEPSWAPDGRHLLFTSTRTGMKQLWVLDTESGRTRQLTHNGSGRMGAWSPHLDAAR